MDLTAVEPAEEETVANNGEIDRINQLPDEILHSILSNLHLKEAAATTIISGRWRHVFPSLPSLCLFPLSSIYETPDEVGRWLDDVFDILGSRRSPIKSCVLRITYVERYERDFYHIIRSLCKGGIEDLTIYHFNTDYYRLPSCVYSSCMTVTKLVLSRCELIVPFDFTGLQHLKILDLHDTIVTDEHFERVISRCPALEELILRYCCKLTNLVIRADRLSVFGVLSYCRVGILVERAPRLESAFVLYKYHRREIYSRYREVRSYLGLQNDDQETEVRRLLKFLKGLGQIKTLFLEFPAEYAEGLVKEGVPFPDSLPSNCCLINLKKLTLRLQINDKYLARVLSCLLNSSPNLQHLAVEHSYSCTETAEVDYWCRQMPSECISKQLTTAAMLFQTKPVNYWIDFPRFLLMNAGVLKKMKISYLDDLRDEEPSSFQFFQEQLLHVRRASPDVALELKNIVPR